MKRVKGVKLSPGVKIYDNANIYGCHIDKNTKIGVMVEVQKGVSIGRNCKISSHSFICEGVTIQDDVFIGHNVTFINDLSPRSTNKCGALKNDNDWECVQTLIEMGAAIGSSVTILGGLKVGTHSMIGAGSVIVKDVPDGSIVNSKQYKRLKKITDD